MNGFKDEGTNRYLDEYVISLVKLLIDPLNPELNPI